LFTLGSNKTGLLDLDAMLHIVAIVQFKSGNRDNPLIVKGHVERFIATIKKNSVCKYFVMFYQDIGHENYRNDLLPEYKGHRKTSDAIKCWKPTIVEAFHDLGAIGLKYIESDDACSILARKIGYDKTVIISSDKDMIQVPTIHYNPYKKGEATCTSRWLNQTKEEAERFFWIQVLTGDPTDMPGALCGIEGMAYKIASATIAERTDYLNIVQEEYTKKYSGAAMARAIMTFNMVRLLDGTSADQYISHLASVEVSFVRDECEKFSKEYVKNTGSIFTKSATIDLFKTKIK